MSSFAVIEDPEPTRGLEHGAGEDVHVVRVQHLAERDIVLERRAHHHVEGSLRLEQLVALVAERRDDPVTASLERGEVVRDRLELGERELQDRDREAPPGR